MSGCSDQSHVTMPTCSAMSICLSTWEPDRSLVDLAQLELDLEALLGRRVDLGTTASLRDHVRSRALAEAIPL